VSCVHGGREWGANAEIELQDCGWPQSKFSRGSREHRRHQLMSKKSDRSGSKVKEARREEERLAKNDETSHEATIADAA